MKFVTAQIRICEAQHLPLARWWARGKPIHRAMRIRPENMVGLDNLQRTIVAQAESTESGEHYGNQKKMADHSDKREWVLNDV